MDLFQILLEAFSLDNRTMQELIEISSLIDIEKSENGRLGERTDELSVIASTIVALINEKSVSVIGKKLDDTIKDMIVNENFLAVDSNEGKSLYSYLQSQNKSGTYKVTKTVHGYNFELVADNGEILATSEVYSTINSCMNGIAAVQKNAQASIEDQTVYDYRNVSNPKYEVYRDREGEYRFRLKSMNGQILMVSGGFEDRKKCHEAIKKMKVSADSNDVEKK